MFLKSLAASFLDEARAAGTHVAALHALRALRVLRHPRRFRRAERALAAHGALAHLEPRERFFYIQHQYHLSLHFSAAERIDCAAHHYHFESRRFDARYRQRVYGGAGIGLWQQGVDGHEFRIRLVGTEEMRREGDLSVLLSVDGVDISMISFSYLDARLFGRPPAPIMFIARNQSLRAPEHHEIFRNAYKFTTPQYFCLSATVGIAAANGMTGIAAIRHDAQIACTPKNIENLKNPYDAFWRAFHATELDHQSFLLPVPMATVPVSLLKAKHRRRAIDRRAAWASVATSATAAVAQHRVEWGPAGAVAEMAMISKTHDEPSLDDASPAATGRIELDTPAP